jgi:hypothetical protein
MTKGFAITSLVRHLCPPFYFMVQGQLLQGMLPPLQGEGWGGDGVFHSFCCIHPNLALEGEENSTART